MCSYCSASNAAIMSIILIGASNTVNRVLLERNPHALVHVSFHMPLAKGGE